MKTRILAVAGSIAALSFAAVPIAQAASTPHHKGVEARVEHSRDASGLRNADKSRDRSRDTSRGDTSRDIRDF